MSKKKVNLNLNDENEIIIRNYATLEEAKQLLIDNKYEPASDHALFYIQYIEPIDEKPDQLLGTKSEDDVVTDFDQIWFNVVAVGPECKDFTVGDRVYIHPKYWVTSLTEVPIKNLKYGLFRQGLVSVINRK